MPNDTPTIDLDRPVWGASEIGRVIGREARAAFHLLERGDILDAAKIGGRWCSTPRRLLASLQGGSDA
jgi:hypothetical protein